MRNNPDTANRALAVLAELYETLTGISSAELADFEQEWRFLDEYLKLMQMRYASTLEVTISHAESDRARRRHRDDLRGARAWKRSVRFVDE